MSTPRAGRRGALLAAAAGALALAGCVVVPAGEYYEAEVDQPPPAPRYEVVPVAPAVGWLWIGGYWRWGGRGYAWVPGYWSAPRPGYRWAPPRWEPYGNRWRQYGGRWVR